VLEIISVLALRKTLEGHTVQVVLHLQLVQLLDGSGCHWLKGARYPPDLLVLVAFDPLDKLPDIGGVLGVASLFFHFACARLFIIEVERLAQDLFPLLFSCRHVGHKKSAILHGHAHVCDVGGGVVVVRVCIIGGALGEQRQIARREVYDGVDGRGLAIVEAGRAQDVEHGGSQEVVEQVVGGHSVPLVMVDGMKWSEESRGYERSRERMAKALVV
jgi:hypothetical protein